MYNIIIYGLTNKFAFDILIIFQALLIKEVEHMYTALDVAKYVIWYCQQKGYVISNLKLQKILYFIQAQFLVFGDVPTVYRKYRLYGNAHIPSFDKEENFSEIAEKDKTMINRIVDRCADYTASQLVELTHRQSPWKDAYETGKNSVISNEALRDFFEQ